MRTRNNPHHNYMIHNLDIYRSPRTQTSTCGADKKSSSWNHGEKNLDLELGGRLQVRYEGEVENLSPLGWLHCTSISTLAKQWKGWDQRQSQVMTQSGSPFNQGLYSIHLKNIDLYSVSKILFNYLFSKYYSFTFPGLAGNNVWLKHAQNIFVGFTCLEFTKSLARSEAV